MSEEMIQWVLRQMGEGRLALAMLHGIEFRDFGDDEWRIRWHSGFTPSTLVHVNEHQLIFVPHRVRVWY